MSKACIIGVISIDTIRSTSTPINRDCIISYNTWSVKWMLAIVIIDTITIRGRSHRNLVTDYLYITNVSIDIHSTRIDIGSITCSNFIVSKNTRILIITINTIVIEITDIIIFNDKASLSVSSRSIKIDSIIPILNNIITNNIMGTSGSRKVIEANRI